MVRRLGLAWGLGLGWMGMGLGRMLGLRMGLGLGMGRGLEPLLGLAAVLLQSNVGRLPNELRVALTA